ncbi:cTAGE family member 2-like [Cynocephalus volans]|uniref:cTAGE family member 2-like n=1 Tax=Cynocephalus volans TaxID=110931 RepID=UPI002FCBF031
MEVPGAAPQGHLGLVLGKLCRNVAALPEDLRPGPGFPWEPVTCAALTGFLILLFLWRSVRSVRSRLYVRREKKLAEELSGLIEEKCKLLDKLSVVQEEYEGLESAVKDASFEKVSTEAQSLEATYEKLSRSKSKLEDEIVFLVKELKEQKSKHCEQDELMADISKRIQSLEDESKPIKSQVAEAKIISKILQMNEERLKVAIKDALNENSQLQESQKQLLQEAEVLKEQVSELHKQKITFEDSKVQAEQVLSEKENHIKSLTERLLKMKDWAAVLGEDMLADDLELEMKSESQNAARLDDLPEGALKKLIHAAKLHASLKTLEGERNQIHTWLSEVDKTKEELTEHINNLLTEQSENTQLESENQNLRQKLQVMTELYQENGMKLHRQLIVEENYQLEKEEKLSKVEEKMSHAAEELETYRRRAGDVEGELERSVRSYQGQLTAYEKEAHGSWVAAETAERHLSYLRKGNVYKRQKLAEKEFKFELLKKDPFALDVPNTAFGGEHSPYGDSPVGRPSSKMRAFLSPLRLSPLTPGQGGGRGSRGPENTLDHQMTNERGESGCDRLTDSHGAPSGFLSPPWEQHQRMVILPPGQPCSDPALLPRRQDRFDSNPAGPSGPAEFRSFNMPSLDKEDGPKSSQMESSRNDTKDDLGNVNVPNSSGPAESEATGPGFAPPPFPAIRGPLFPVDMRGPFMRREPPFPPPPPGSMYGAPRNYFLPRVFPPPPPFAMRNVYSPRGFPPTHKSASILPGDSTSPDLQEPLQRQGTFIKDEHSFIPGQLRRAQGEFALMTCQCQAKIKYGSSKPSEFAGESSKNAQKIEFRSSRRFCRRGSVKFKLEKDPRKDLGQDQKSVLENLSEDSGSILVKVLEDDKESSESDLMRHQECDQGNHLPRGPDKKHLEKTLEVHLDKKLDEINEGMIPESVHQPRLAASHAFPKSHPAHNPET